MNSYILWIIILEGCYQGLHWGLKLLQVLWIKIQDQEDAYSLATTKLQVWVFYYFSYNPSYYSLLVMICDANSMQVVQPHPPCVTCQGLCVHCLLTMLCQSFIFNNFEGKYSKFFPLSSLLDFVVNKFPKFVTLLPTHGDHVSPLKPKKKWLSYESTY
jgi:hypothetical protein